MADTTVRQIIFTALIFFSVILGAFTLISSSLSSTSTEFGTYNATFDKFKDIKTTSDTMSNQVKNAQPTSGVLGILNGLVEASWGSLKLAWQSVTTLTTMVDDSSEGGLGIIKIPLWLTAFLGTLIVVTLAFALMAAWFKWYI